MLVIEEISYIAPSSTYVETLISSLFSMKQEVQCSSLPFKQQKFYGQNALLDALMVQGGHLYDRSFAIMTSLMKFL